MTFDDITKAAQDIARKEQEDRKDNSEARPRERDGQRHHHRHHHRSSKHRDRSTEDSEQRRYKRRRREDDGDNESEHYRRRHHDHRDKRHYNGSKDESLKEEKHSLLVRDPDGEPKESEPKMKRDAWMEEPSEFDIEYKQAKVQKELPRYSSNLKENHERKIHENEINKHLADLQDEDDNSDKGLRGSASHEVDYIFGDEGSQWRMTRLKAVYTEAERSKKAVEEIATERYGDLRAFDEAREERRELDRRETYGQGYVGLVKPSGELFAERKIEHGVHRPEELLQSDTRDSLSQSNTISSPSQHQVLDQTALNKLKARMMKAKLRNAPDAASLEAEFSRLSASFMPQTASVVLLDPMENRMLAGGRKGEVKEVGTRRGKERGLVTANDDMTIDDMVREERGSEGRRFAERIAKDGKFEDDLEYMEDNATKLATRVHQGDVNLRSEAISTFQKTQKTLDTCPLCYREDTNSPPVAPVVSLATRTFLTLPTAPEIVSGGAMIVPIQHRKNLLECDDDEWEELRNFMKSLTRYYAAQSPPLSPVFYENAARPQKYQHAALTVIPLPPELAESASAFFKESILAEAGDWSQHKPIIKTDGKGAFRRMLVSQMPYFHVWFTLDSGIGHVVEDAARWPKGDLFAREVLGGMLDVGVEVVKARGKWRRGEEGGRLEKFKKNWSGWDWTKILSEA